jgi:lambda family phage tail tape measure protein
MSKTFSQTINDAINSVAQNFTKLIMGAETWKQALQNIESTILSDIISAIIRMFEQWIVGMIMQATVGKAIAAASTAANIGIAAAESAIWATPATLATIASYGGAAYAAPGLISLAEGLTMASIAGRESGGPVEAGTPYIVGEKGQELFIPDSSGRIVNARDTARMVDSSSERSGSAAAPPKIAVNFFDDRSSMLKKMREDSDFHHVIVDVVNRNSHIINPRT